MNQLVDAFLHRAIRQGEQRLHLGAIQEQVKY